MRSGTSGVRLLTHCEGTVFTLATLPQLIEKTDLVDFLPRSVT